MAKYNRPPKKKDKGPDEFISFFDHLVRYFTLHKNKLIAVIVLGVLAFGAYGYYLHRRSVRVREFATLYGNALQAPKNEALKVWESLQAKKPPLSLREVIAIQMGSVLAEKEKWLEAAQAYQRAAKSKDKMIHYLGVWAKAVSLENAKKYSESEAAYQLIANDENNPFQDYGKLGQARILSLTGRIPEAEALLSQLIQGGEDRPNAVTSAAIAQLLTLKAEKSPSLQGASGS